jgi:hypothetical protein
MKVFKILLSLFFCFSVQFGFAQLGKNVIIFEDVVLNISESGEIQLNLKVGDSTKVQRKVEIYETLYDVVVVDAKGEPNGVVLVWDATEYSGKWVQTKGEYDLSLTYLDNEKRITNKKIHFIVK